MGCGPISTMLYFATLTMRTFSIVFAIVLIFTVAFILLQGGKDLRPILTELRSGRSGKNTQASHPEALTDREHLYKQRRKIIEDGCRKIQNSSGPPLQPTYTSLVIDKKHFIYYCPIAKVSSTFWTRMLTVLASDGKLSSPFEIGLDGVRLSKLNDLSKEELAYLFAEGSSFMFVRDPYARLFSGYENKIYHANLMFWKLTGRQVVHTIRQNNDDIYKEYGFDVTFSEFIKYILYLSESEQGINGHFSPMNKKCNPCSIKFQYIGKLETISDDVEFLLSKWENEFNDVSFKFDDFQTETILDTAKRHVWFLFETKKILNQIKFPFIKIMIRTWRDLQIRGYLSKYIDFPYKEGEVDNVTREEYFEAIKKALKIPVNRTEVKKQRKETLIQAYRQISLKDMERLRKYVLKDCLLFGYDDRPKELFDRTSNFETDFTYLEGLSTD